VLEGTEPVFEEETDRLHAFEASKSGVGQIPNRVASVEAQHRVVVLTARTGKHTARTLDQVEVHRLIGHHSSSPTASRASSRVWYTRRRQSLPSRSVHTCTSQRSKGAPLFRPRPVWRRTAITSLPPSIHSSTVVVNSVTALRKSWYQARTPSTPR